jgi:hypothetical protein
MRLPVLSWAIWRSEALEDLSLDAGGASFGDLDRSGSWRSLDQPASLVDRSGEPSEPARKDLLVGHEMGHEVPHSPADPGQARFRENRLQPSPA